MRALEGIGGWPGRHGALALRRTLDGVGEVGAAGGLDARFELASVTKLVAALAVLVAVAEGRCALDFAAGPPGATLAHLLAHASGLPLDAERPIAAPGTRRIYSNTGIELAVAHAASASGTTPRGLLSERVLVPLGMRATDLVGSVASGALGTVRDAGALAAELLEPTLVGDDLAVAARSVAYPGLDGVLPGFGPQHPCDFGLGPEVKGTKRPHWAGPSWPPDAFGHFGQQGGFVLVDAGAGVAVVTLGDAPFGEWAKRAWPAFTDAVRGEALGGRPAGGDRR